jgi:hypothetical protein
MMIIMKFLGMFSKKGRENSEGIALSFQVSPQHLLYEMVCNIPGAKMCKGTK